MSDENYKKNKMYTGEQQLRKIEYVYIQSFFLFYQSKF